MLIHSPKYTHNVMIYDVVMIHFASYPAEIFATRLHGLRIDAALLPTLLESRSTQRLHPPGVGAAPHADTCTIASLIEQLSIFTWSNIYMSTWIIQPYVLTHLGGTWPCFCYFLSPLKTYHRFKTYKSCKVSGKPPGCKRKKHILQGNHNNHNASWTFFLRHMSCTNFPAT